MAAKRAAHWLSFLSALRCWPRPAAAASTPRGETPRACGSSSRPGTRRPLKQFQEATYADPNNADAYYNLAATYHRIGKVEHRQADLDQAETYYNLCLDRNDNHTDCYRGLAVLLAEQGRNDEAFRLVEGWVQRQPTVGRRQDRTGPAERRVRQPPGGQGASDRGPGRSARQCPRADRAGQDSRGRRRQGPGVGQLPAVAVARQPPAAGGRAHHAPLQRRRHDERFRRPAARVVGTRMADAATPPLRYAACGFVLPYSPRTASARPPRRRLGCISAW